MKNALILGLVTAGIRVRDIGPALSPMAYFAQFHLDAPAVAMVTASHNPNGWTGVKMGFERPLTHGPDEMAELKAIVMEGRGERARGRLLGDGRGRARGLPRRPRGRLPHEPARSRSSAPPATAPPGAFAPELLERIGVEVVPLHTELDYTFPHYNPNPEAMEMLHDMAAAVKASGADLGLGLRRGRRPLRRGGRRGRGDLRRQGRRHHGP